MRILYLIPFFKPYEVGGAEISTYLYSDLLSKGHKVFVLTPNYKHFFDEMKYENKNFVIYRFAFPFKPKKIMALFDTCIFQFYLLLQTFFVIKKFNIDLVHIQSSSMIPGPFFASKLLNKKVIITIRDHGYEFIREGLKKELKKFSGTKSILKPWVAFTVFLNRNLRKLCIKNMNKIVAVSKYRKDCVKRSLGIGYEKINVSYMLKPKWAEKYKASKTDKKYRLLFLGRLDKAKGIELLLKAFASLKQRNVELLIAGNSNVKYYKNFVKNLYIKNVKFLGKVSHKDMKSVYEKADAVVLPSFGDSLSRVLIEAGCLGKPVIATDRGGSSEVVINKKTGILVKDLTPEGLAKGMEYAIRNPKKMKEMGKNIKKLADDLFDPEKNLKIISKIYMELL